jgi:hypothetical protein
MAEAACRMEDDEKSRMRLQYQLAFQDFLSAQKLYALRGGFAYFGYLASGFFYP